MHDFFLLLYRDYSHKHLKVFNCPAPLIPGYRPLVAVSLIPNPRINVATLRSVGSRATAVKTFNRSGDASALSEQMKPSRLQLARDSPDSAIFLVMDPRRRREEEC